MKRTAVIGFAAFYLMLTTGMFVCIVHCLARDVFKVVANAAQHQSHSKPNMAIAHLGKQQDHHKKEPCTSGKDCKCCDQHGSYVVKENIKPSLDPVKFQLTALKPSSIYQLSVFQTNYHLATNLWTDSHAPPGPAGITYLIQIRTLLI
ncbi:hypothetical protein [Mucilaginibacter pedocola]|uniref:Uncharacterized protein n=1 Tax=Mucilaginibacter pedocola TaxID=1792845 RepID=A0A1S9PM00_9SPHI|nr:hypothetical protein [Mucilaginibacter pedocola]OOQ61982.1 hypothetical protein BC343_02700 [Mucilaginibacter pedocola]